MQENAFPLLQRQCMKFFIEYFWVWFIFFDLKKMIVILLDSTIRLRMQILQL